MIPLIPIISALTTVVPSIAKWIGGDKAEDAAQSIASIAMKVTGLSDPTEAKDMILKDPEAKLKFMTTIEDNRTSLDKAYLLDRQNARKHHKHSVMPAVLSGVLTLGLLGFVAALMFIIIPVGNKELVHMVFGSYLTAWLSACAYWFGTTRGSADKDVQQK